MPDYLSELFGSDSGAGLFGDLNPSQASEAAAPSEAGTSLFPPAEVVSATPFEVAAAPPTPIVPAASPVPVAAPTAPTAPPPAAAQPGAATANPLEAALDAVMFRSIFEQFPVFKLGSAEEEITDSELTFEQLREQKAEDFPEMEDAAKVTWKVDYGPVSKSISTPKKDKILAVKQDIERSADFTSKLKKAKDKNPTCYIKPEIRAQKKGIVQNSYKQECDSYEEACASDKLITLFPSTSGVPMERRVTEAGEFITPKAEIGSFDGLKIGFTPALPRIPNQLLHSIMAFFLAVMERHPEQPEALANIYWDRHDRHFVVHVPQQIVSHNSVEAILPDCDEKRFLHYMDIHSHNTMPAFFSKQDNRDERATRLYAVVGRLDRVVPELKVRICNGGTFWEISPKLVFEPINYGEYNHDWQAQIQPKIEGGGLRAFS